MGRRATRFNRGSGKGRAGARGDVCQDEPRDTDFNFSPRDSHRITPHIEAIYDRQEREETIWRAGLEINRRGPNRRAKRNHVWTLANRHHAPQARRDGDNLRTARLDVVGTDPNTDDSDVVHLSHLRV